MAADDDGTDKPAPEAGVEAMQGAEAAAQEYTAARSQARAAVKRARLSRQQVRAQYKMSRLRYCVTQT